MTPSPLTQFQQQIAVETTGPGCTDITDQVSAWVKKCAFDTGLLTVFIRHTSASLTIPENADPLVLADLADSLDRLAPRHADYRHATEGPDDMPAHIRAMLTSTSLAIPVNGCRPLLGTWQGIYLIEHRDQPHRREIVLHLIGQNSP